MSPRLTSELFVSALLAQVSGEGGFGAVLRRGDRERGDMLLLLAERGDPKSLLERRLGPDGTYAWADLIAGETDGSAACARLVAARERFDPDFWLVELDVADSERFIADRLNG